jgi:CRP/FNR family transcriptional regulator, anaerobic regulatory protein
MCEWAGRDQEYGITFMHAQLDVSTVEQSVGPLEPSVAQSPACDLNFCQAAAEISWAYTGATPHKLHQTDHTVPARRTICREQDLHDAVPVISSGWAASIVMLSDGSRQILSFLLPGDIVSTALLFEPRPHCLVEAVTEVRYSTFRRSELKDIVFRTPELLEKLSRAWIEEKTRSDELIVDLGRRTADERIARLILSLVERLVKRDMARTDPMEVDFPLRQHHIADATGLTPVHVSKVLSEFRRNGLIRISERSLAILDPAGFRRIANTR